MVSIDFVVYVWLIKPLKLSIGESKNSPQSGDDSPHLKGDSYHSVAGRLPSFDLALRIVDKSNWIGKTLVFPSALLPQVKVRPELAQTGVYLPLGACLGSI